MANLGDYDYDAPMFFDFQSDNDAEADRWFGTKNGYDGGVPIENPPSEEEEMVVEDNSASDCEPGTEPGAPTNPSQSEQEMQSEEQAMVITENQTNNNVVASATMVPPQTVGSAKRRRPSWKAPRRSLRIAKQRQDSSSSVSSVATQHSEPGTKRKMPKIKPSLSIPHTPEVMKRMRTKPPGAIPKTREEQELERIANMQKELASRRKQTEQYMRKALSARSYAPHRSDDGVTHPQAFNFATDQRVKPGVQATQPEQQKAFESTLRQHPPSPSFKNRGITKPVPFQLSGTNLSKKRKEPDNDDNPCGGYESMAQSVYKFQKQTPPRFRTKRVQDQNQGPEPSAPRTAARRTQPKTPTLSTKERKRPLPADCLSRQQQEEKEAEEMRNFRFKAREFDPRIVAEQGNLGVKPLPRKPLTETRPFAFEAEERLQQSRREEPEEKPTQFKARPVPDFEKVFKPETQNQVTEVEAFSFEGRDKQRLEQKEQKIQSILEAEKKAHSAFQAQLLPNFTPPPKPAPAKKPLTEAQPFQLSCDSIGAAKAEKWMTKVQEELQVQRQRQVFKAHSSNILYTAPFRPKKSEKPCTEFQEFDLHSEKRAEEREHYEMHKREKEEELDEIERQRKQEQEEQEKIALAALRKQLVHKPNPIRRFKGVQVQKSSTPLTDPKSPEWQERRKKLRV